MANAPYLVLAGPTGSGKSDLALKLAVALDAEIISCDSVQVYRGFDLGAAKPSLSDRQRIPHHLVDVADWRANFDAACYGEEARRALQDIRGRGRLPLVVGGTGLYLRALLGQGWHEELPQDQDLRQRLARLSSDEVRTQLAAIDPERAAELHPNDRVRLLRSLELVMLLGRPLRAAGLTGAAPPDPAARVAILEPPRAELHRRIAVRADWMLANGLLEEVAGLLRTGVDPDCKPMRSIGYRQVVDHLAGLLALDALGPAIVAATRQYAKRQCTWFRRVQAATRFHGSESLDEVAAWAQRALASGPNADQNRMPTPSP